MVNTAQAKRNSKRKWLLIVIALLFAVGFTLFVLEKTHVIDLIKQPDTTSGQPNPTNTVDYSPATTEESNISNQVKQNDSSPTVNTQNLQVTLTRVIQDETTRSLIVRALIEGTTTGSCRLELIKNSVTILSKEASILQQNNFATCEGFDISASEFPSLGEVTVKLTVNSDTRTTSSSQNVMLEK